jgi:uncharacterized protein DUF1259
MPMPYSMKPLACDPARVKGMSERLIISHYENNYGGAVKRLWRQGCRLYQRVHGHDRLVQCAPALRRSERRRKVMVLSKRLALVVLSFGLAASVLTAGDWHQQLANGLGKSGSEMPGGVYRVSLPRTDLKVALDSVELKPAFALGSWLAFKKVGDHVVVMGDLVLTDTEINPVMKHLVANGVGITAIHNHLLRASPNTMYMHVHGHGDPGQLAATLRGGPCGQQDTRFKRSGGQPGG